jgi:hypothetical protein
MHAPEPLIRDLLASLKGGAKPYADVMEPWCPSCSRLPVWKDVVDQDLIRRRGMMIELTDAGLRRLHGRP